MTRFTLLLSVLVIMLSSAFCAASLTYAQSGFILRGGLTTRTTSTDVPYFKIGEAVAIWVPGDSALLPGLRALEGHKVVITIVEDR